MCLIVCAFELKEIGIVQSPEKILYKNMIKYVYIPNLIPFGTTEKVPVQNPAEAVPSDEPPQSPPPPQPAQPAPMPAAPKAVAPVEPPVELEQMERKVDEVSTEKKVGIVGVLWKSWG